ncbi:MAG: sulfatase family protein [Planctomycetota bacterium]|jgi:arylsulfatase A-like enzyme
MDDSLNSDFRSPPIARLAGRAIVLGMLVSMLAGRGLASMDPPEPPNVVIIFADDLGYGDLGVYGATEIQTPHLDRMAAEGMRLTSFYVAQPVCSASRCALLTGCYPNRLGITGALGPGSRRGLQDAETTLAEICQSRGYATAVFGKWHLGHHEPFLPSKHGFDEFYGIPYSNDMWPLHPDYVHLPPDAAGRKRGFPPLPLFESDRIVKEGITAEDQRQFTRSFTMRAVEFIERHADERFFVYVAHPMPHVPLYASSEFDGRTGRGMYADVIAEIDWSAGTILEALRRLDIDDETLVIFTSDNGPWLSYGDHAGTTGPLREGKGTTFEGGVRVPCIMRWRGTITGGRVCDEPLMTIDILPTIATLLRAPPPTLPIDGRDASRLLLGAPGATSPQEAYFFYYHRNDLEAVRSGRWKLHLPHRYRTMDGRTPGTGGTPGPYDGSRSTGLELYDLHADIGETNDVAADHPEVVDRLMKLVQSMRADLGDDLSEVKPTGRRPARVLPKPDAPQH